jgi:diguanylate cyclase (GGDEF)-like protein
MRSVTTQTVIILLVALLIADAMFAYAMLRHSRQSMTEMVHERMLDLADTAADLIDGDVLEALTAADQNTAEYLRIYDTLARFKQNITLDYIYTIRSHSDGSFTFIADPAEDASGFGTPVVATDALRRAAAGESAVDSVPYTDEWGSFYSAYSPVFNSRGEVSGIVTADFSALWYEEAVAQLQRSATFVCFVSLLLAAAIVLILGGRLRKRLDTVNNDLHTLSGDLDALIQEIPFFPHEKAEDAPGGAEALPENGAADEIGALNLQIHAMQQELRGYIAFARAQAHLDSLTGLRNQNAYFLRVQELNEAIAAKTAEYTVFVVDLNGLKNMNDAYGHDAGDEAILDAANVLREVFPDGELFRIGGDEFAALLPPCAEAEIASRVEALDAALAVCNGRKRSYGVPLAFSKGAAVYDPAQDMEYKDTFRRADQAMYKDKAAFYARNNDRRRR